MDYPAENQTEDDRFDMWAKAMDLCLQTAGEDPEPDYLSRPRFDAGQAPDEAADAIVNDRAVALLKSAPVPDPPIPDVPHPDTAKWKFRPDKETLPYTVVIGEAGMSLSKAQETAQLVSGAARLACTIIRADTRKPVQRFRARHKQFRAVHRGEAEPGEDDPNVLPTETALTQLVRKLCKARGMTHREIRNALHWQRAPMVAHFDHWATRYGYTWEMHVPEGDTHTERRVRFIRPPRKVV